MQLWERPHRTPLLSSLGYLPFRVGTDRRHRLRDDNLPIPSLGALVGDRVGSALWGSEETKIVSGTRTRGCTRCLKVAVKEAVMVARE